MATASGGSPGMVARTEETLARRTNDVKERLAPQIGFWKKLSNDWVFNLSAMLAYYLLLSVFPILLVIIAIGGLILGSISPANQAQLESSIVGILPPGTGPAVVAGATRNLNQSAGLLLVVGIVVALFTGSRLFINIENCFGIIFRLRGRDMLRQNLMAIGMLLLYTVLVPIVLLASLVPAAVLELLDIGSTNPLAGFVIQAAGIAAAVATAIVLFGAIYVVVPNRPVRIREVWKGTVVAGVLLVLYELLFPIYMSRFLRPQNYGSAAGFAVVILVFFYYLAFILLLGAEINSWASGQRQSAGKLNEIMHEVQAHDTTRGAAGPTAGQPQEDLEHREGAEAMRDEQEAIEHERQDHRNDTEPPKYAESGVAAPGYKLEPAGERKMRAPRREGAGEGSDRDASKDTDIRASAAAQHVTRLTAHTPSTSDSNTQPRELTERQRRTLGAFLAASTVALVPVVRWFARVLRGEGRHPATE